MTDREKMIELLMSLGVEYTETEDKWRDGGGKLIKVLPDQGEKTRGYATVYFHFDNDGHFAILHTED